MSTAAGRRPSARIQGDLFDPTRELPAMLTIEEVSERFCDALGIHRATLFAYHWACFQAPAPIGELALRGFRGRPARGGA